MVLFRAQSDIERDRRREPRSKVDCEAILRTYSGNITGTLWDLSLTGARFQAESLPGEGATALIEWLGFDAVCRVVWVNKDMCGLHFERPLHRKVVDACVTSAPVSDEPTAAVGNIPLGKKRGLSQLASRSGGPA